MCLNAESEAGWSERLSVQVPPPILQPADVTPEPRSEPPTVAPTALSAKQDPTNRAPMAEQVERGGVAKRSKH